jgi:predicted SnoaL-like aldol condensation-catalyzing enzyme
VNSKRGGDDVSKYLSQSLAIVAIAAALAAPHASATAAAVAEEPVFVAHEFHKDWANDHAFIDKLARDDNPRYEANKRLVLDFEAALEHAQTVKDGEPGNFEEVVDKYLTADYVQYDPVFPPGRDGLLGFFKMVRQNGEKVSHPPVMVVAQGDLVVLTMMRPPLPDPADASKTYTAYRIAIWRVCGNKLCAHWGPDLKEAH